ncbi:sirohydrochlorin chelatase [Citricoccus muralis]|uniref:CbiX/SirB N-terminal domain-containing protein n=1 Tax=Citricoccus muralis TaxID=169134 RepID=A0ABY8H685_9MICC|nr:CbiX/SirB N-terminal domain-containing protein [Citricoccus muralis]WFP16157.1 CbiX/SirB N-terminal domain-containing protein [Citricoccus muralis]
MGSSPAATTPTDAGPAALAAISHGTSSSAGQAVVQALTDEISRLAASDDAIGPVRTGHVDVQQPDIATTLGALDEGQGAVLVPLLLSAGFHVNVDMRDAVAEADRPTVIAGALGPDERLAAVLERRLTEAGADPQKDTVILAAAGSSDSSAVDDVEATARLLSDRLGNPVRAAYLSFAHPTVPEAIHEAQKRAPERRVAIVSYLLAPGYFQGLLESRAAQAGAVLVSQPLMHLAGGTPRVPEELPQIVLDRYHACV